MRQHNIILFLAILIFVLGICAIADMIAIKLVLPDLLSSKERVSIGIGTKMTKPRQCQITKCRIGRV